MPHPALPPDYPPAAIAPSLQKANPSPPLEIAPPQSSPAKTMKLDGGSVTQPIVSPAPTEGSPSSVVFTADFVNLAGQSRADLLNATSRGYLQQRKSPPPAPQTLPTTVSPRSPEANRQPSRGGADQPLQDASNQPATTSFYSLTGSNRGLSGAGEATLMDGLSRAIELDKIPTDLAAPNVSIQTRTMRFDILAQGNDPLSPFFLPVPSRPLPIDDETGPVFSFPSTLPAKAPPEPTPTPPEAADTRRVIELTADRQEYDQNRQIFIAEGRVSMRYQGGVLDADRLQVNLSNRIAVAEGNVAFTRGSQVLRGQRMEYNFVQGVGAIQNARGEIFVPQLTTDLAPAAPSDVGGAPILGAPASDRITSAQPTQNVTSPGGASFGLGVGRDVSRVPGALPRGGEINRLRFEAEQIDFTPTGWVAKNIQITNDPFSPPQFVVRADRATLNRTSPLQDELRATYPRIVFDQKVSLPLPLTRTLINRGEQAPPLLQFGFDGEDRGGLFVQRPSQIISNERLSFILTPQIYIQRAIFDSDRLLSPENFGAIARLSYVVTPLTTLRGFASLTSLKLADYEDNLRASVRLRQLIGTHSLNFEASYRDRLFNGSLGFQTVQSTIGLIFLSPTIALGNTGLALNYQAGFQYINSDTDQLELLDPIRDNNRTELGRFQASATLRRAFTLWQGKPLPATPTEGLRYTPNPIIPYVAIGAGVTGVTGYYTNGDSQNNVIGSIAFYGQFGHFSRPFFDYTGFSVSYVQVGGLGQSPFLFDRTVDNRTLIASLTQQIYGPLRLTVQTSINLDSRQQISTDYILEISRRAYGILFRYNPILEIGSINLRVSDFNWTGGTEPFAGSDITPVEGGVRIDR